MEEEADSQGQVAKCRGGRGGMEPSLQAQGLLLRWPKVPAGHRPP